MNDAHFHLVVNHFPIVGVVIGFLVLLSGFIIKGNQVKSTALFIFIFSAVAAIFAFYTGEGAEEVVENMANVSDTLIHEHEEHAEVFYAMMLVLGGISIATLFLSFKKFAFAKYGFIAALLLSLACMVMAKFVGTSGGEIMHTEIRSNADKAIEMDVRNSKSGDHHD